MDAKLKKTETGGLRKDTFRLMQRFALIAVFFVFLFGFWHEAQAATLGFSSSDNTVLVDATQEVTVVLNSQNQAINAAEATITFPQNLLSVENAEKLPLFTMWPDDPFINNTGGVLTFAGGLANPGFNGPSGQILKITIKGKAQGDGELCFSDARTLLNDGNGTNVYSSSGCYAIHVRALPQAPAVSSSTHPNPSDWYAGQNVSLTWESEAGVNEYSYLVNQQETSAPDNLGEGADLTTSFSDLTEGIWYFHIKANNANGWGPTTHFRIQIDVTPPEISVELVTENPTSDRTPVIIVDASDALSGLDAVTIILSDGTNVNVPFSQLGESFTLPQLGEGVLDLHGEAVDKAANTARDPFSITVEIGSIIEQVTDIVRNIIPEPVKQVIENLRNNETIKETTKNIIEPIARAAAAIGVVAIVATTPFAVLNAIFTFFRFLYIFLAPLFYRKRRKPWGRVIDSITQKGVQSAIVRLFETEFNKLKATQPTDAYGRFGFLVEPGEYTITVQKAGFTFPSTLTKTLSQLSDVYIGGKITVEDKDNPNINVTIPVDPELQHISIRALVWKRFRDRAIIILEQINWPLLIIGFGISLWSAIIIPNLFNIMLILIYMLLMTLKYIQRRQVFKSFGSVFDAETRKPVDLAVVRIFNATKGALITTRITNGLGRFTSLVQPGTYYLVVAKPPYAPKRTDPIKLSKAEALAPDIFLEKGKPQFSQPGFVAPKISPELFTMNAPKQPQPPTQTPTSTPFQKPVKEVQASDTPLVQSSTPPQHPEKPGSATPPTTNPGP